VFTKVQAKLDDPKARGFAAGMIPLSGMASDPSFERIAGGVILFTILPRLQNDRA